VQARLLIVRIIRIGVEALQHGVTRARDRAAGNGAGRNRDAGNRTACGRSAARRAIDEDCFQRYFGFFIAAGSR
jgi:hypothetical protein